MNQRQEPGLLTIKIKKHIPVLGFFSVNFHGKPYILKQNKTTHKNEREF
jgi:hypothetical protein